MKKVYIILALGAAVYAFSRCNKAGTFPEVDRFGEALNNAGDGNLIGHFRQLTRSRRTHAANAARIAFDQRLGMSEGGYIAARHHGKRAGFGSRLTT